MDSTRLKEIECSLRSYTKYYDGIFLVKLMDIEILFSLDELKKCL